MKLKARVRANRSKRAPQYRTEDARGQVVRLPERVATRARHSRHS